MDPLDPLDHRPFALRPLLDGPRDRELARRLLEACSDEDRVRRAGSRDVQACLPWLLPRAPRDRALLAHTPREPIGIVNVVAGGGCDRELAVLVHPRWRRRGVGLALLEAATHAYVGGVTALLRTDNIAARRLAGRFLPGAGWTWCGTDVECRAHLCPGQHPPEVACPFERAD